MSIINNEILGQMKPVRSAKPIGFVPLIIGSLMGIFLSIGLKTIVVYYLWNLLLVESNFGWISFRSAYAITAISSLLMIKYSKSSSGFEIAIDLILKSLVFLGVGFVLNYI